MRVARVRVCDVHCLLNIKIDTCGRVFKSGILLLPQRSRPRWRVVR